MCIVEYKNNKKVGIYTRVTRFFRFFTCFFNTWYIHVYVFLKPVTGTGSSVCCILYLAVCTVYRYTHINMVLDVYLYYILFLQLSSQAQDSAASHPQKRSTIQHHSQHHQQHSCRFRFLCHAAHRVPFNQAIFTLGYYRI